MCLHLVILIDVFTLKAKLFISKRKTNSVLPTDQVISDQPTFSTETPPPPSCLNMEIGDLVRYRKLKTRIVLSSGFHGFIMFFSFSFSTGFITCFLHTVALTLILFLISRVKHTFSIAQDPMDWEMSLISMFLSSMTSFLWIWRNEQLREFAETGLKKIISKMNPLYQVNI